VASHSICRIQLKDAGRDLVGYASGFLIGPGVLMTNHHVLGSPADAANSIADFDYELDLNGMERHQYGLPLSPANILHE
jgi:endonuclease G